ncbi:energy transducer TonB [Psychroserpens mesophilus]|uniref:energy transducer TonB n=1 Tax=Psychroserpens mesophilus TaxID=325473 RepID=UPI000694A3A7|nr:energy transducer TonB [Psychroserpens mesophilus]
MKSILSITVFLVICQISASQSRFEDGPYKTYYETGEVKSEGHYLNGKPDGKWIDYYENGQISREYSYADGKYVRTSSKSYFEDGTLENEIIKEDDYYVSIGYYESGNLRYKRKLEGGFYKEYRENGLLKIEANYVKSDLYGFWKLYHNNGNLAWQVNYLNGYRNGEYKQFYENGQLKLEGVIIKEKKKGEEKRYTKEGHLEWKGYYDIDKFDKTWIRYNASKKKVDKVKFKDGIVIDSNQSDLLEATVVPDGVIEKVPLFPGCEYVYGNTARKNCMSAAIATFVNQRFNTNLALDKGLTGRQRIAVIFKIGKEGEVTQVRARAPHPALEKEAIRVIKLLPKMKPGYQNGKPVIVPYSLPILFQVKK